MSDLRKAAQQALEALEFHSCGDEIDEQIITALRDALAQQEPALFTVTKTGALLEWEPTAGAFDLPDGKHFLYIYQPHREKNHG